MSQYAPNKNITAGALLFAAKNAANECSSPHPEDIACAMLNAIEYVWPVLVELNRQGVFKEDS